MYVMFYANDIKQDLSCNNSFLFYPIFSFIIFWEDWVLNESNMMWHLQIMSLINILMQFKMV